MKRVIAKISLNPDNQLDAKLIAALKQVKNKSAHLRLALVSTGTYFSRDK